MKLSQKLALEASEKRQRINELLGKDELTDDERGELSKLTTRMQQVEVETRAAIVAEAEPAATVTDDADAATRELRALTADANMGAIFGAVLEHRATDGREAELQTHFKLAGNQIPLAMLETRAVTPAPANVGQTQSEIVPAVFPASCAAFLGVDMPTVGVGEAVFPVLSTSAIVRTPAENADADETTGAFTADVLSPSRLQASFFYSREDRARFAGMGESLRMNLSDALADGLDKEVLQGTNGLFTGTNLANNNVNAETSYAHYREHFLAARVDGRYAMTYDDLRIVMGSATFAHADSVWRGTNTNNDVSALDVLMQKSAGVKVSAHVPAAASNKQNAVIRRGMRRDMVAPIWEGVTILPDEVTKAKSGEIVITAVMLHAVKILRADGFYKQQTQHA